MHNYLIILNIENGDYINATVMQLWIENITSLSTLTTM